MDDRWAPLEDPERGTWFAVNRHQRTTVDPTSGTREDAERLADLLNETAAVVGDIK